MGDVIEIYGTKIRLPDEPPVSEIINYGKDKKQQKFIRTDLPDFFEVVEYNKDGDLILTPEQETFAAQEVRRCKKGVWVMIGGRLRYITGKYYFFLQYYILEDGTVPDFREADRLYYLFHEYWFDIDWCLGNIRIKKRRQGASSQSCSNILYEAIFFKNSNCGLISKTKEDSQDTFTQMITAPYRELPVFLKPKQVNKEDSVTKLIFAHKSQNIREGVASAIKKNEGNNSTINFKAPVLNAYDRGRMSYVLGDEFGKYPKDVPANQLLGIISKTLVKGVKRVGWIDMPSTTNEMSKGGGEEYKKIWDKANQFVKKPTINRIVRFYQPAYEAYEGFIDEFGDSVIGEPDEETYEYLVGRWVKYTEDGELKSELCEEDVRLGARQYVEVKRREGLEGIDLEEEIRMNPCTEEEAFMYAGMGCEFNSVNIQKQIKELEDNPPYLRKMRLVPEKKITKSIFPNKPDKVEIIAKPMDDEKGEWLIYEFPEIQNHFKERGGYLEPLNTSRYGAGADTTKENPTPTKNGSKPVIVIMDKIKMYPVAMYVGNPRIPVHMDEQALLGCKLYGCKINYEIDARTDYYRYFVKNSAQLFLVWTPKIMMNPVKRNGKVEPGVRSGDPFQFAAQTTIIKSFIDGTDKDVYNGHVHKIVFISLLKQLLKFNVNDRTEFDEVIALIMALTEIFSDLETATIDTLSNKIKILPQYTIKMVS